MNKETIVFYLKRHLRELEDMAEAPSQRKLAEGVSYERRRQIIAEAEAFKESYADEMEAFRLAIETVEGSSRL